MDDKTSELRDIFVAVTEEETVTESQAAERGSLATTDEETVTERVRDVVGRMREEYDFRTDLDDDALVTVVRGFYDGDDDADIAESLGVDPETVFEARLDLHLLADDDTDVPFELSTLRERRDAGEADPAVLAADLDATSEAVERALAVLETQDAVRRVSHRFQSEFEDAIPDAALAVELTSAAQEDGLREAAEDIETDTKF